MDSNKKLLYKSHSVFIIYKMLFFVVFVPLFFFTMKFLYEKDLDELINFRTVEFKEKTLPEFKIKDIELFNKYNEDLSILTFDEKFKTDKPVEEFLYNSSEGHNIYYRIIYKTIYIEVYIYILMSKIPMIENKDLFVNLCVQYSLIFLILAVSMIIMQRIVAKRLWAPFYDTIAKIESYDLEKSEKPDFNDTDVDEFKKLNDIVSDLILNDFRIRS